MLSCLKLGMWPAWNGSFWSITPCLFPRAGVISMCHHIWFLKCWDGTQNFANTRQIICQLSYISSHRFCVLVVVKNVYMPGVVAHAFNPSTREAEAGGFLSSNLSLISKSHPYCRRDLIPTSYPWTSIFMPWHTHSHTYTDTQKIYNVIKRKT